MGEVRREVEIMHNAWKKMDYEWFVIEDGGEGVGVCVEATWFQGVVCCKACNSNH